MTELVLVRHAETLWNAEERWQGQTDVALSDRGRGEVARVAERLRDTHFDRVISSDLVRAHDTARGVAPSLAIERDEALREMHLGAWCGLLHREVVERYPDQLRALQRGDDTRIGGDGESVVELGVRVMGAMRRIVAESEGRTVLVVTHGGVIRALLLEMLGLTGRTRPLFGSRNTAITRVGVEGDTWTLRSYNDARHLAHDPLDGEEAIAGAGARETVAALLGLESARALAVPSDRAVSRVVSSKKQLVSYALDP